MKLLSADDVAKIAGVHEQTVRRWAREGRLKGQRSAGGASPWRFTSQNVADLFALTVDEVDRIVEK